MSRPRKLDAHTLAYIGRSYTVGVPCSDLAKQFDVSMSYVINTAREWQHGQAMRRLKFLEQQARKVIASPPPLQMQEPPSEVQFANGIGWFTRVPKQYSMRTKNNGVVERTTFVALPFVSIQHPKGD